MGPREESFRRRLDILDDRALSIAQTANPGVEPVVRGLRLQDALEEALGLCDTLTTIAEVETGKTFDRARDAVARLRALL